MKLNFGELGDELGTLLGFTKPRVVNVVLGFSEERNSVELGGWWVEIG